MASFDLVPNRDCKKSRGGGGGENRYLLDVEEAGRLQHQAEGLHQLGLVHRVHALVDDLKEAVAGLLSQLLHRHLTQQQVHKPTSTGAGGSYYGSHRGSHTKR